MSIIGVGYALLQCKIVISASGFSSLIQLTVFLAMLTLEPMPAEKMIGSFARATSFTILGSVDSKPAILILLTPTSQSSFIASLSNGVDINSMP